MLFKKSVMTAAVFAVGSFAVMSANAATTDNFDIGLTVDSSCNITDNHATNINFDKADNTIKSGATSIEVVCSKGVAYKIALTPSNANTSGLGVLKIGGKDGTGDEIGYKLTKTTGGTAWGNVSGTNTLDTNGAGAYNPQSHGITVATTTTTDVIPGSYVDTVTVSFVL
ncbi:spore coat protein U domain-containing protein [Psychrobacter sp.]|uniref:spore coat protein U domain-containing protein n=1 Tax=Psychrobacter sp. TaxID=56811 RepID=UPI0035663871